MATYWIFGAAGSIGREVALQFLVTGHRVFAWVKNPGQRVQLRETLKTAGERNLRNLFVLFQDVTRRETMEKTAMRVFRSGFFPFPVNGVVYAVGHCPPGGIVKATKQPLSQLPLENYRDEIDMHQIGVLNVFQCLLKKLENGGCFVFLSSAITRLRGNFPPFLQAHYHASVVSAEDWLVEGMRHDPEVVNRGIKIHRLALAAVDTPFHCGRSRPSAARLIPVEKVAREVVLACASETEVDKQIL